MDSLMCWALGWLLQGLIGYAIGDGKGRATEGFFLGALLGPFGLLFALLMKPSAMHVEREMRAKLAMEARLRNEMGLPGGVAVPEPSAPPVDPEVVRLLEEKRRRGNAAFVRLMLLFVLACVGWIAYSVGIP